jgi:Leishmanolysin
MENDGTLDDVITHEMGHVIGIGTIWTRKSLLQGAHTANPTFTGANAKREYGRLRGSANPMPVPVENSGGAGTQDSHWRDTVFGNELMTGFVGAAGNPLSRMTVASLKDLGYTVNLDAAEPYSLPSHLEMAEAGMFAPHAAVERGVVLPRIPMLLPPDSLA